MTDKCDGGSMQGKVSGTRRRRWLDVTLRISPAADGGADRQP